VLTIREIPSGSEDSALSSSEDGEQFESTNTRKTRSLGNVEHTGPSCENTTTACNKQERKRQYKWKSAKLSKAETAVSFAGTPHPVHSVTGENLQHPVDFFSVLFH